MGTLFYLPDWYWFVGGDDTQAYSSARNVYVDAATDAAYLQWKEQANPSGAVPIESEVELWYYIKNLQPAWLFDGTTFSQPAEGQYTKPQLKNYALTVRIENETGGITAEGIPLRTDPVAQQRISNARTAAEVDPLYTTTALGTDGVLYPIDATQIIAISDAFIAFATSLADTYAVVHADIDSGTVTTPEQIDTAFAGVTREVRDGRRNHFRP